MKTSKTTKNCRGRADPFGLLIAAVLLAVSMTAFIQAQAALPGEGFTAVVSSVLGNKRAGG